MISIAPLAVDTRDEEIIAPSFLFERGELSVRNNFRQLITACFGLLFLACPLLAHHSVLATYDTNKVVYITGVLAKVEWTNPHMFVYVDVKDSDGKSTRWAFEGASPNLVTRTGVHREDFVSNISKVVTVRACPAKDGSPRGSAETIKVPDGRELPFGGKRFTGDQP